MKNSISLGDLLNLSPKAFTNKCFIGGRKGAKAWNRGISMPVETRLKISEAQKGINRVSFEARSRAQKGKTKSLKHRENISKARKGKIGLLGNNPRARAVMCPAGTFDTIKEAAQAMNCDGGTMRSRIKRQVLGYRWYEKLDVF
jgi:hypothetical protein